MIDPMGPDYYVVAFGIHKFGYNASCSKYENLIIIKGLQALAGQRHPWARRL